MISLIMAAHHCVANEDDIEQTNHDVVFNAPIAQSAAQLERYREEKSLLHRSAGLEPLVVLQSAEKTAKESAIYKKYKSLYSFQRRLFKPTQEEYDEIREAAYAEKNREIIIELEGNGIQNRSVWRELASVPFTFVWNNRKAVICVALGATIAWVAGNVQGKRQGFENGKKVASPCKYGVFTNRKLVLCTIRQAHIHTLYRTSPGEDVGTVTITNVI